MKKKSSNNFAIIGVGMVGTAIGCLLKKSGHNIIAISDKSAAAMKRALPYTGGDTFRNSREAAQKADCILITTPDDMIYRTCKHIANTDLAGIFVFHMSGAGGLDLLEPAKEAGANVASIHPLQSFSSVDNAIQNIPGSVFGITSDKKAKKQAQMVVRDLNGVPIFVSPDQKALYHAAACFTSNYLVTLLNIVESLYKAIGVNPETAHLAYMPLICGTLKNIETSGTVKALTGPIARGDAGTIRKHITAIKEELPQYLLPYLALGQVSVEIARNKGTLSVKQAKIIRDLLKGVSNHEHTDKKQS